MDYIYETHMHTSEASACAGTPGRDYIEYMIAAGYSGMIVTDHFFNGNSRVPRDLPWADRIEQYCSGYEHAREAAEVVNAVRIKGNANADLFTVLFGVEYNFECDEYLIYGIDKDWLLRNPDILSQSRKEVYDTVHAAGAIMVQAHPYRERGYIEKIHLTPDICDGAEIFNAGNPPWQDALAYQYATEHSFLPSAGSDIHRLGQHYMGGMQFPYRIETIDDYVRAFLSGDGTPVFCRDVTDPKARFRPVVDEPELTVPTKRPSLPVVFH